MSANGPEFTDVEEPFINQLVRMGWKFVTGNRDHPTATGRESFRDVLLEHDLKKALHRINLDHKGESWLDDDRLTHAVSALKMLGTSKLIEANDKATTLLLKGTVVDGVDGWDHGRGRTVHFIDWDRPENNTFLVINQFRVDEPGGQSNKFIAPDLVLFVNGIPLVVVECKAPGIPSPVEQAINQIQRYANQRSWVDGEEGNERLFHTNQIVIATSFDEARVSTFSAQAVHYLEWKDTSPTPMAEAAAELGKVKLSSQEMLVAGMLRPAHLLDIVRHFTLFMTDQGRTFKVVCRYQQFRAVQLAVSKMLAGKTRKQDGEHDQRGGIIWHTQGSGKSLTMVFLVRKMRSDPKLRGFKVVFVTDRKDLQKQLADTATLTDETLTIVKPERRGQTTISSSEVLKETLARPGKDLVFAMIQKYRGERDAGEGEDLDGDEAGLHEDEAVDGVSGRAAPTPMQAFAVLNESEEILVMVDEAHRSHTNTAHANMMQALPNCVRIGFTGTPIIMGDRRRTHEIFGAFIDRYTIKQSEADGSTIPILYEGRTTTSAVKGGGDLDGLFENMLADRTPAEMEAIQRKYATKGNVMEAEALIAAKARDMLRHYVDNVLPNGFKAQVVAVSRRATIRYNKALREARDELVADLDALEPAMVAMTADQVGAIEDREVAFRARARRFLPMIRVLDFAPVISGAHNDDPAWGEWTERAKIDSRIARFKRPLPEDPGNFDHAKADPLAFLIVKSMLLTGFDAPIEQVMYLDRHIKEAELLQAIARVNRTRGDTKRAGLVVDYYGVAANLKDALAAYAAEDVEGALQSLADEIPKLRDRRLRAVSVFTTNGISDISETLKCVELLRDEKVRADFQVKLKHFLATLDLVLPRPEGLEFVNDARQLAYIQARAKNLYRGGERLIGKEVGEKVRKLIDDHIISRGIDPRIPPISLTDPNFKTEVDKQESPRAKASEMEHALRYHLRKHMDEDPTYFEKLSVRLEGILKKLANLWDAQVEALGKLIEEANAGRQADDTGLDPETQAPFYDVLRSEVPGGEVVTGEAKEKLIQVTVELVDHITQEIRLVGFWRNAYAQTVLRNWVVQFIDDNGEIVPFARQEAIADRLVELARANHAKLAP